MNAKLLEKIKTAHRLTLDDWVGGRIVNRSFAYLNRVREIVDAGDFIAGRVQGSFPYVTQVYLNETGEFDSVCSCPVACRCKHAVALILAVQQRINTGVPIPVDTEIERIEAVHPPIGEPAKFDERAPVEPQKPIERVVVRENPFERWTRHGKRRGRGFSFRVEQSEAYSWDFIVSSLVYALAKGGLDYDGCGSSWSDENPGDPPLFTCSCGDAHCGGFGPQRMAFSTTQVVLSVDRGIKVVEFEFERIRLECWVMLMLWRMRGSGRLRRDPWQSTTRKEYYKSAVNCLLDVNPRCRAIWRRLAAKRKFDDNDFTSLAQVPCPETEVSLAREDLMEIFGQNFTTCEKMDLTQVKGALWHEEKEVERLMEECRMRKLELTVYSSVVGRHWQPTDLHQDEKVVFVRGAGDDYNSHSIRVESETRGETIGYLRRSEAVWMTDMMDRHGLVLNGHVEKLDRDGKSIPIRVDLSFEDSKDYVFDWGAELQERSRLYFEMLRTLALRIDEFSVMTIKTEMETIRNLVGNNAYCAEVDFLLALITSGAKAEEYRLTDAEIAKRLTYCANVRRAMTCEPVGDFLEFEGLQILPLRASVVSDAISREEAISRVESRIRLSWESEKNNINRRSVTLPKFPSEATGFGVFRGQTLLDVCLLGYPVVGTDLFDNFALYDHSSAEVAFSKEEAFESLRKFLCELPVRERGEDGFAPHFWLERGIHNGEYDLDNEGRLLGLRLIMMTARKQWVD